MTIKLRQDQLNNIDQLADSVRAGYRRVVLQAPCGAGKTAISSEISKRALNKGKNVLFCTNRRDLAHQTYDKYTQYGLGEEIGFILSGEKSRLSKPIQICTYQTYIQRLKLGDGEFSSWFHNADIVFAEECHNLGAITYSNIINLYGNKVVIGLSATPAGSQGKGLGHIFQKIIQGLSSKELIKLGNLVPMEYYAPSKIDFQEFKKQQCENPGDKPRYIGDVFENWAKYAGGKSTLIFARNIKHSLWAKEKFEKQGVIIDHIDYHTTDDERERIYKDFESKKTQVLTNVGMCTEGSDFPWVEAIVIMKNIGRLSRYIQIAGRGMRPFPGKEKCILIDHTGCVDKHKYVEDDVVWSLDGKKPAVSKKYKKDKEKKIIVCEMCCFEFSGKRCPQCMTWVKKYGKKELFIEGELKLIKGTKDFAEAYKKKWWSMLEWQRQQKGYKPGWTSNQFKSKFKVFPRGVECEPREPDDEVERWLKYQMIRWIKGKQKEVA